MDDITPIGILQTVLSYAKPYLPAPVTWTLNLSLKALSSLPPSLANVLPLLLAAFAAYTAIMSAFSTARYALRTTWFLLKYGVLAAGVAWAMGVTPKSSGLNSKLASGAYGAYNRWQNGYYGGNPTNPVGGSASSASGLLGNLLQDPVRTFMSEIINIASPENAGSSAAQKKQKKSSKRAKKPEVGTDNILADNAGDIASNWIAGMAGKAWEAFNDNNSKDRWAESRVRRNRNR